MEKSQKTQNFLRQLIPVTFSFRDFFFTGFSYVIYQLFHNSLLRIFVAADLCSQFPLINCNVYFDFLFKIALDYVGCLKFFVNEYRVMWKCARPFVDLDANTTKNLLLQYNMKMKPLCNNCCFTIWFSVACLLLIVFPKDPYQDLFLST